MSQSVIGALRANLGLDAAQFERGVGQAQRGLRQMRQQFVAVAAAAAAFGAAITAAAMRGAADIDRIVKSARRLDASVGAFQALELAASEAGVSLSGLADNIQTINREIAANSAGAQRSLRALRLTAAQLSELDADERMALIADRIRETGMSAAQASVLLRDLGIRNREMVLLMLQGGDVFRQARQDIRDYGLEIDDAMGARIEQARDRIARLGLVTQYFGQRLAADVVPALGRFALAITESLREGGALRAVLDGIVGSLDRVAIYVGVAVAAFGIRYVAALVAARLATMTFAGSLLFLRGALIRTGIGALIVGAGELVYQFTRLVSAAGGFGNAMQLLGAVGAGVWRDIGNGARALYATMQFYAGQIAAAFIDAFRSIFDAWDGLVNSLLTPFNMLMEATGQSFRIHAVNPISGWLRGITDDIRRFANDRGMAATEMWNAPSQAAAAWRDLSEAMADSADDGEDAMRRAQDAAARLAASFENAGDAAGGMGASARAAVEGVVELAEHARDAFAEIGKTMEDSLTRGFMSIFDGTKSAAEAFRDMARQIISELFRVLVVQQLVGQFQTGGGGILGALAGGLGVPVGQNANGTSNWRGGLTLVGERGAELVNLPRGSQVMDAQRTSRMLDSGGDVIQNFHFNLSANGDESVRKIVAQAAPQIVEAAKSGVLDERRRGGSFRAAFG